MLRVLIPLRPGHDWFSVPKEITSPIPLLLGSVPLLSTCSPRLQATVHHHDIRFPTPPPSIQVAQLTTSFPPNCLNKGEGAKLFLLSTKPVCVGGRNGVYQFGAYSTMRSAEKLAIDVRSPNEFKRYSTVSIHLLMTESLAITILLSILLPGDQEFHKGTVELYRRIRELG